MGNRPYSPTTILIHEEVLKQLSEPPHFFHLRDITDETGVSRQHTVNILTRMVRLGLLERDRGRYRTPVLKELVNYVLMTKDNDTTHNSRRISYVRGVFTDDDAALIKNYTNMTLFAQQNRLKDYSAFKQDWMNQLETARAALLKELKFVRSHSATGATFEDEDVMEKIKEVLDEE